ncbi:hypothetical protein SAMN05216365_15210 [Porphyromonadaceae bacterium NLAE-zl-C104]|jgi:hypothetical protein|uniref:hypothetical protein n=1 Tax=Proteiniphilum TaxID=294702 RepID=UPI000896157F|nr:MULTISPECIES: hypothetical protein [Proteiniphilum]MDY9918116.1 hypothetical protein [Proteiniphilum sp.]SEA50831.1 hypothetical protein SAMN05216331_1701 [Porphyromonadaceae bacterium KH3R12]SFT06085.1 hypothetical protein SAMN05216365_15210 [Porphyromonadaceae bacterium NLAE-zl-C104]
MGKRITRQQIDRAREALEKAPVESMIRTFASRVRSRGELGGLAYYKETATNDANKVMEWWIYEKNRDRIQY